MEVLQIRINQVQFSPAQHTHSTHTEYQRTSDLVCDLDKEAETFSGLEKQPGGDVLAKLLGFGAGVHLEGLQVPHRTVLPSDLRDRHKTVILCRVPRLCRRGNTLYGRSGWFYAGWPPPPPGEEGTSEIHCCHQQSKHVDMKTWREATMKAGKVALLAID